MFGSVDSCVLAGLEVRTVRVEADIGRGGVAFFLVGLAATTVNSSGFLSFTRKEAGSASGETLLASAFWFWKIFTNRRYASAWDSNSTWATWGMFVSSSLRCCC